MVETVRKIPLGKKGLTKEFLNSLKNQFKKQKNIKIKVLQSAVSERAEIKTTAEKITKELGDNYTAKVIGFTIAIKKWRKPKQNK